MNFHDKKHLITTLTGAALLIAQQGNQTEVHARTIQAIDECIEIVLLLPTDKESDRADTTGFDIGAMLDAMRHDGETEAGHAGAGPLPPAGEVASYPKDGSAPTYTEEKSYPKDSAGYGEEPTETRNYPKTTRFDPSMPPVLKNALHKLSEAVLAGVLDEADHDAIGSMIVSRGARQAVAKLKEEGGGSSQLDELINKARETLAERMGISVDDIKVISITR